MTRNRFLSRPPTTAHATHYPSKHDNPHWPSSTLHTIHRDRHDAPPLEAAPSVQSAPSASSSEIATDAWIDLAVCHLAHSSRLGCPAHSSLWARRHDPSMHLLCTVSCLLSLGCVVLMERASSLSTSHTANAALGSHILSLAQPPVYPFSCPMRPFSPAERPCYASHILISLGSPMSKMSLPL